MNTAAELLDQLKSLPRSEQAVFVDLFQQWQGFPEEAADAKAPPAERPNPAARRRAIFGEAVLPNMVLAAREQERY